MSRGRRPPASVEGVCSSAADRPRAASGAEVSEVLDPGRPRADRLCPDAGHSAKAMTIGQGGMKVAMLPLSAPGSVGDEERKMRDGASSPWPAGQRPRHVDDRGYARRRHSPPARWPVESHADPGAKAVIGPTELAAARRLVQVSGEKRPRCWRWLKTLPAAGIYSIRLSRADSAASGSGSSGRQGQAQSSCSSSVMAPMRMRSPNMWRTASLSTARSS